MHSVWYRVSGVGHWFKLPDLHDNVTAIKLANGLVVALMQVGHPYAQAEARDETPPPEQPDESGNYRDDQLVYAATARCQCGAGLAYVKGSGGGSYWDCSDILTGRAAEKGRPGSVMHDDKRPFIFWEVTSENAVRSAQTTRPRQDPAPRVCVGCQLPSATGRTLNGEAGEKWFCPNCLGAMGFVKERLESGDLTPIVTMPRAEDLEA